MMPVTPALTRGRRDCRRGGRAFAAALLAFLFAAGALVPAGAAAVDAAPSIEALDNLVGPIALYPDDLIAIILPAATSPLQLVQADRFLDKRKANPQLAVDERWDDAVKSLLNYPEVVKMMSGDLDWTSALGEAVVADQGAVLEAIQVFRRRTQAVGNLKTDDRQVIVVEKEVIRIVPANPQVIYVPQYNPTTVIVYGGYSTWAYYPTPYPVYYYPYPPGAAFATGLIWGAAIGAAWNGGRYVAHYGGSSANINISRNTTINNTTINNTTINNTNINRNNVNRNNVNNATVNSANVNRPGTGQSAGGGSTPWKPSKGPGQVSGTVGNTPAPRVGYTPSGTGGSGSGSGSSAGSGFGSGSGSASPARPSTQPAGSAGATAPSTRPAGANPSTARPSNAQASAGGSAFSGYGSGREAQLDSSRGAQSRGSSASTSTGAVARQAPAGGAARAAPGGAAPGQNAGRARR